MPRTVQYRGSHDVRVELRYQTDMDGKESLDEIVAPGIHVEMLDDGVCWADIYGVRVTWGARKKGLLELRAEPDTAVEIAND